MYTYIYIYIFIFHLQQWIHTIHNLEHNLKKKNFDKLTAGTQHLIPRSSKRVTFAPNKKNYEQAKISHA